MPSPLSPERMESWPTCACGCGQPVPAATFTHKKRGKVKGQPQRFARGHRPRRPDYEVDLETGCWLWLKQLATNGYGRISDSSGRHFTAHRVYWERLRGPLDDGLELHHECGTKRCVNPNHLRVVTRAQHRALHGAGGPISEVVGVSYNKPRRKWIAMPWKDGRNNYLGAYATEAEAIKVVTEWRERYARAA